MATHSAELPRESIERAIVVSQTVAEVSQRLHVTPNTLRRYARGYGIDVAAALQGQPSEPDLSPAERLKRDMEAEGIKQKARHSAELLQAAKSGLRSQGELLAEIVAAKGDPLPCPKLKPLKQDRRKPHRSVVVHVSDWHGGQGVSAVDTGGNVYDWHIMLKRQQRFLDGIVGSVRNVMRAYCIDELVLAYTGDMLEGYKVYNEQGYQLCKDAGAQVVDGATAWASFELALREAFPGLPIARKVVFGNHGLPEGRKGGAVTSTVNYEYIWVNLLEAKTEKLGISSEYATHGRLSFEVAGQPCLITHGDEIRGQLGIPFYGIRTAWMKHTQELGAEAAAAGRSFRPFRYFFFGHIHQTSMVTYGNGAALSCGDAVGYNNLTGKLRNPSSTPQQSVYFLSRERGLDEISYIHLVEAVQ